MQPKLVHIRILSFAEKTHKINLKLFPIRHLIMMIEIWHVKGGAEGKERPYLFVLVNQQGDG